ncbi:MAG TPA: beta-ketoacyl synthase N-terminal-like domain-containing protein [Verrucomicrobiae bacterium]
MGGAIVITGIGLVTPLGDNPREVLRRIEAGESAASPPMGFDATPFACPVCAEVKDFRPQAHVAEVKRLRLMNRDAQLAVAAARLALQDARLEVGVDYRPDEIGLFAATGLAGLPLADVTPLIRTSTSSDGQFDLAQFGQAGLRSVSPILSFKILSNMPLCFVSICENIRGANAVYTPWEGHGAQAIEAGVRAIQCRDARCAVVGGCDVKTHELAFMNLEQHRLFDSWKTERVGVIPGEGAVFLVLEEEQAAVARGARTYAHLGRSSFSTMHPRGRRQEALVQMLRRLGCAGPASIVAAGEDDPASRQDEEAALQAAGIKADTTLHPKRHVGNLFAAAALLQIALAALLVERFGRPVLANCLGHGSEQAAFVLEST